MGLQMLRLVLGVCCWFYGGERIVTGWGRRETVNIGARTRSGQGDKRQAGKGASEAVPDFPCFPVPRPANVAHRRSTVTWITI
jgi:hypothetical protein